MFLFCMSEAIADGGFLDDAVDIGHLPYSGLGNG
ncbi:hypothetical protein N184_33730 [Sinorhizobium sp. GL28]|nr:hypothetical protein N184_33730 [Sinorhizobium sp. GL28]